MSLSSKSSADQDRLKVMFEAQKAFQKHVSDVDLPAVHPGMVIVQTVAMIAELGEVLREYEEWKPWKKNPRPFNPAKLREEIADLWHFIINLTLALGMDAQDLFEAFTSKNVINWRRQREGY